MWARAEPKGAGDATGVERSSVEPAVAYFTRLRVLSGGTLTDMMLLLRSTGIGAILLLATAAPCIADNAFPELEHAVVKVLQGAYAGAELQDDRTIPGIRSFAANMRSFTIYRTNKTGSWQAPRETMAPDRGGISVRFRVAPGAYEGAAVLPVAATNDLHLFKETHVIKNSADGDWHIWAEILTPRVDSPDDVKVALVELFSDFERFL